MHDIVFAKKRNDMKWTDGQLNGQSDLEMSHDIVLYLCVVNHLGQNIYEKYMFSDTSFIAFLQQFYCNFTQVGWTKWSRDEPGHCIVIIRYPSCTH